MSPIRKDPARFRSASASVRSSSACAWPSSESSIPANMRESSRTRPPRSNRVTPLDVTMPSLDFSTTRCTSAKAATCGR